MNRIIQWFNNLKKQPPINDRKEYKVADEIKEGLKIWITKNDFADILNELRSAYITFTQDGPPHPDIDFLNQDASNGFILDVHHWQLSPEKCLMLLAFWKDHLLEQSYINSMSDIRLKAKGSRQYSSYRHYLKPSLRKLAPGNQRFGNIELVCQMIDGQPDHIKVQCNAYVDSKYDEAEDFGTLLFEMTEIPN
jgi:hypothetical protein